MGKIPPSKVQEVIFASSDKAESRRITTLLKKGEIRKIAPRIYTSNFSDEPAAIIKRNWFHILSGLYPEALLSHRSALEFVPTSNGHVFLTYTYTEKVQLPGLTIQFLAGPSKIEGDNVFFGSLHASQEARSFLENLQETRRKSAEPKTLTISQIEERLEAIIRARGENGLNALRDKAKEISSGLGMEKEFKKLNQLISDLLPSENLRQAGLATGKSKNLKSPAAIARSLGEPLDPDRIKLFESLYEELAGKVFPQHTDQNTSVKSYKTFAFFEGYFSNYIEGTEFTVEEAKEIITTETPIPARDEDSHDILGTYRIISDKKEMAICPSNANDFLDIMRRRHAILLQSRISKKPGEFKDKNNRAGNTEFVDKQLVAGTLKKGFEWYTMLKEPFAKAVYMMFLISEVHPFNDGNGRIARVMMNAELSAKGLSKIIVPTVYREDYMGALRKLTRQRSADAYVRMLLRAYEFSSTFVGDSIDEMEKHLIECDAFKEPKERLVSPLDAWANLSPFLQPRDLEKLKECVSKVLKSGNPLEESHSPILIGHERIYSEWSREGLIQSLILIAIYGESLKMPLTVNSQEWVDGVIQNILHEASGEVWISLDHEMPLVAEASPSSFISAINDSLSRVTKPIMAVFNEIKEDYIISPSSNHTGLLWALEGIAWLPEFLIDSTLILARLAAIEPGGKLANRPISSLIEIFKPWHYETLANVEERKAAIDSIVSNVPSIGWTLLRNLLPQHNGVAHPTHKMRWRMFDKSTNISYTWEDIFEIHSFAIDHLISLFDFSEEKTAQLVDDSKNLKPIDRRKVLGFLIKNVEKLDRQDHSAWHTARKILANHRSHSEQRWALPESELSEYQELYDILQPNDPIGRYIWLFDEHWPEFAEGGDSYSEAQESVINERRKEALTYILNDFGIETIIVLSKKVKEPYALGDTLAKIVNDEEQILAVTDLLRNGNDYLSFVQSFLFRKAFTNGFAWIVLTFNKLQARGYTHKALGQFFVPMNQSKQLWDFVNATSEEVRREYWISVYPRFYRAVTEEKIIGIRCLIEYRRYATAVSLTAHFVSEIPTQLIIEMLSGLVNERSADEKRVSSFEVEHLFDELDKRQDVTKNDLFELEWKYLPVLASFGSNRSPKILHNELINNPHFFVEVLKWVYLPKNRDLLKIERVNIDEKTSQMRSHESFNLLHSLKIVPGFIEFGNIDKNFLNEWVDTVRRLAKDVDRLEVCDGEIGRILAQYPEKDLNWPPDKICEVIERLNTSSLKSGFSAATFNKRGSSIRGPFDGGDIERGHAQYFQKLSENRKAYPVVRKLLSNIADGFLLDAKRMDEEAEREKLEF